MTQKQFMILISLLFIALSFPAILSNNPIYFALCILLANLWAIASHFKE